MTTDGQDSLVTQPTPVDLAGVRDTGMQAIIMLAVSLGWNVNLRINQPAMITSRTGHQRRIPTNTSIKMSVFQQHLTAILVYTDDDHEPTIDLIDAIIKRVKPSQEHARRLRLAVGETPQMHRERLADAGPAHDKREPDEHLTQQIEVPEGPTGPPVISETPEPVESQVEVRHIVSREPYYAHYSSMKGGKTSKTYVSDSSFRRVWSDGVIDFECMVCGKAFTTPRGVGGHKQVHIRAGEATPTPASITKRPPGPDDPNHVMKPYGPREIDRAEYRTMKRQLAAIREALGIVDEDMAAERDRLVAELAEANARIQVLEGNLLALREILSDIVPKGGSTNG